MQRRLVSILLVPFALSSVAAAQDAMGILHNVGVTAATRGGIAAATTNPVVVFDRLDADAYAGFGFDPVQFLLGNRVINGVDMKLQDQDGAPPPRFRSSFSVRTLRRRGPTSRT